MTKKKNKTKAEVITIKDPAFTDMEFFDDCPICQGLKKAKEEGRELSLEELKELFNRANNKS